MIYYDLSLFSVTARNTKKRLTMNKRSKAVLNDHYFDFQAEDFCLSFWNKNLNDIVIALLSSQIISYCDAFQRNSILFHRMHRDNVTNLATIFYNFTWLPLVLHFLNFVRQNESDLKIKIRSGDITSKRLFYRTTSWPGKSGFAI